METQTGEAPRRNAPPPQMPINGGDPQAIFTRYKWEKLTESEREAVRDCISIATTRAGMGLGTVLTVAAVISNVRRGKATLPRGLRYGSLAFFSLAGAYAGFMSAGQLYAQRILSVPDSRLADDLRIVIGDWQSRNNPALNTSGAAMPHEELPSGEVGAGRGKNEIIPRDPKEVRQEERAKRAEMENLKSNPNQSWSDRMGLTNKADRE